MAAPRMSVAEWQKRLADTFTVNGLVGGHLLITDEAENNVSNHLLRKFHGQDVLLSSFQSFFIETLLLANMKVKAHGWPKNGPNYPVAFGGVPQSVSPVSGLRDHLHQRLSAGWLCADARCQRSRVSNCGGSAQYNDTHKGSWSSGRSAVRPGHIREADNGQSEKQ